MTTRGAHSILLAQGGSSPVGPFDPSILSGLTYAMSANDSAIYKGGSTTAGLATANGDIARRIDSLSSITRTFYSLLAGTEELETDAFGPGLDSVRMDGNSALSLHTRPTGTATPSVTQNLSSLFGVGTKLMLWAGTVYAASPDTGLPYTNTRIMMDTGQYCGLLCYQTGGNIVYQWYNYSSGEQVRTVTVAAGTPVVLACRHDGGNLRIASNSVSWSATTASGNTDTLGSVAGFGPGGASEDISTAAMVTCNATSSDANILTVVQQMGALVGLSL